MRSRFARPSTSSSLPLLLSAVLNFTTLSLWFPGAFRAGQVAVALAFLHACREAKGKENSMGGGKQSEGGPYPSAYALNLLDPR